MMDQPVKITRYPRSEFDELVSEMARVHKARLLKPQFALADTSTYRSTSVSARSRQKAPECGECGVCCAFPLIVNVPRGNEERLSEYWEITEGEVVIERVLGRQLENGHCTHLEGVPGESSRCGIYLNRPDPCRDFDAGSDRCLEYRRMYGIDPQLTEAELNRDIAAARKSGVRYITDSTIQVSPSNAPTGLTENGETIVEPSSVMSVKVGFDGGESDPIELFQYDAGKESWLESEFLGLTMDEAHLKIAERFEQGVTK